LAGSVPAVDGAGALVVREPAGLAPLEHCAVAGGWLAGCADARAAAESNRAAVGLSTGSGGPGCEVQPHA